MSDIHHKCRSYSKEFDAYYCANCNEWLENPCSNPECDFCSLRPERPIKTSSSSDSEKDRVTSRRC
jgi:hypothetical protein